MKIIVSLTSTFERSHLLFYTIQSLLRQTHKPDVLMVNISKNAYLRDSGFKETPEWLLHKEINVNYVENTGSYRKLLPAIENSSSNDIIVTADDDILYGQDWLKNLLEISEEETDSIVCCRARRIKENFFRNWQNYSNWGLITEKTKGVDILATGGAGAVYRKKLLDLDFINDEHFLKIAPTTDDLWFRMASMRNNIPVVVCPQIDHQNVYLLHGLGLEQENFVKQKYSSLIARYYERFSSKIFNYIGVNQSKNDIAWDAICKYANYINLR